MHFLSTLMLLGAAIASVSAGPYLVKPTASDSFNSGKQFTVTWIDNNNAPTSEAFGASTLYIATGSSTQHTNLATLGHVASPSNTTEVKITVDASWGPDSDLYFILLQSDSGVDSTGIPLQSFSARFSLTKMTGTFSSAVLAQISGISSGAPVSTSSTAAAGASGMTSSGMTSSGMATTTAPASTGSASATVSNAKKAASATSTATSGAVGLFNARGVLASLTLAAAVAAMVL
ncbi:hypothetical protein JCM1841_005893 [Sporobolomyces salmonicolor]